MTLRTKKRDYIGENVAIIQTTLAIFSKVVQMCKRVELILYKKKCLKRIASVIRSSRFQIDISKTDYSTDQPVKWRSVKFRPGCKMRARFSDVTKFSGAPDVLNSAKLKTSTDLSNIWSALY